MNIRGWAFKKNEEELRGEAEGKEGEDLEEELEEDEEELEEEEYPTVLIEFKSTGPELSFTMIESIRVSYLQQLPVLIMRAKRKVDIASIRSHDRLKAEKTEKEQWQKKTEDAQVQPVQQSQGEASLVAQEDEAKPKGVLLETQGKGPLAVTMSKEKPVGTVGKFSSRYQSSPKE